MRVPKTDIWNISTDVTKHGGVGFGTRVGKYNFTKVKWSWNQAHGYNYFILSWELKLTSSQRFNRITINSSIAKNISFHYLNKKYMNIKFYLNVYITINNWKLYNK